MGDVPLPDVVSLDVPRPTWDGRFRLRRTQAQQNDASKIDWLLMTLACKIREQHYVHAYIHTYIRPCIQPSIHPYIHASMHPWFHASMHPWFHASMHPCIHASMIPCIHASIHPSIHMHRHTFWVQPNEKKQHQNIKLLELPAAIEVCAPRCRQVPHWCGYCGSGLMICIGIMIPFTVPRKATLRHLGLWYNHGHELHKLG